MDDVKKLDVLAQDIMDLYYQDFKEDNEQFFDHDYFVRQVEKAYSFLLNKEFKEMYERARQERMAQFELLTFDTQWLKKEEVTITKDEKSGLWTAKLSHKIYSFTYDKNSIGFQDVTPVKYGGCNLVRSTLEKAMWILKHLDETEHVYWWAETEGRIMLTKDCCKEINVYYVAAPDKDLEIQSDKAFEIQGMVLNLMLQAKEGVVIDMTNDSNANKTPQTETNKETLK